MNTPERDPLGAMFDQYAATTAAETTRSTTGQLRRRMHRHRTGRFAAAGVAAAVLAVPGVWALQNAGAADEPLGAADQGATSEEPPCLEEGRYALLAEGTTIEDYLAADEMGGGLMFTQYETIEELVADPGLYRMAELSASTEVDAWFFGVRDAREVQAEEGGPLLIVEFYGTFEQDAPVQVLYPCEETPVDETAEESGTPGEEPTEAESEAGEEPTEASEEPTDAGEEEPTTPGDDEEPTTGGDEEPTTGDDEEPTISEEPTP